MHRCHSCILPMAKQGQIVQAVLAEFGLCLVRPAFESKVHVNNKSVSARQSYIRRYMAEAVDRDERDSKRVVAPQSIMV